MSDKALHSKLGASSYYRWKACPGSVKASEGIVVESSIYADEGTLAHDIAAERLLGKVTPLTPSEMEDAIDVYVEYIEGIRANKPAFEAVEQKLNLSAYHPELFGTADYVAYFKKEKCLYVVDYKHGAGIPVEVTKSPQLMYYGLGALHANKFPIERVVLTIVQPRCYHPDGPVRSWETDPITMMDFAADLIDDANKTEDSNAPLNPGDHCRFCPAQPTCPAVEKQALATVTSAFSNLEAFDPDKVAKTLAILPQVEAWCKSFREYAYQQAMLGNVPPGYKLVDKRATRKWMDNLDMNVCAEVLRMNPADLYEQKLKSIAQVEKLIPKDNHASMTKSILDGFTVKESSGKNLVPISDDREPVKGAIESMFGQE